MLELSAEVRCLRLKGSGKKDIPGKGNRHKKKKNPGQTVVLTKGSRQQGLHLISEENSCHFVCHIYSESGE